MHKTLKPALTYEEQIKHLSNKGLIFHNKKNALTILKHENYYRLSGYMIEFLEKNDKFENGECFEDIYNIYKTDKELRSTLYELINDIEVYLKTKIANFFSLKYGPDGYRNPLNFGDFNMAINFINDAIKTIQKNRKTLIVRHHEESYSGILPLWALVELMSFGSISRFYTFLSLEDKKEICNLAYNVI